MANPGQRYGCYVGNIDSSVPLETVRQVFSQCGTIMDCSLNGRDTDPYRFGFIDFAQEADRERALKFNGVVLAGRPLKVGVSKGNVNRPNPAEMAQQRGDASAAAGTLLAQLIQSGALNPANLTPEQQQQLSGALLSQLSGGSMGMPSQMAPLAPPPMMGMQGGYGMQPPQHMMRPQHSGGYVPGQRSGMRPPPPSANPPPSAETMALREAQRKTFFDVVRKEADKYQEKLQRKKGKRDASGSDSDGSSSSSDDEGSSRRRRKESSSDRKRERSSDRKRERSSDRDRKDDSHSNNHDQRNAL